MSILADLGKISSDENFIGGALIASLYFVPGGLILFHFDRQLFMDVDPVKLLLLISFIMTPLYIVNYSTLTSRSSTEDVINSLDSTLKGKQFLRTGYSLAFIIIELMVTFSATFIFDLPFIVFYIATFSIPILITGLLGIKNKYGIKLYTDRWF